MHWTKQERGFYTLDGTDYAVMSDGYEPGQHVGAEVGTCYEGFVGGEWAVVRRSPGGNWDDGENLDWFPTMREAREATERWSKD